MLEYGHIPENEKGIKRFVKRIIRRGLRWLILPLVDGYNRYHEYGPFLKAACGPENQGRGIKSDERDIFSDNQLKATLIKLNMGEYVNPISQECDMVTYFSASDSYSYILGTLINSIIVNADDCNVYDLVILQTDMTIKHMNMISALGDGYDNVSIRFVDVNELISVAQLEKYAGRFTYWTLLRLLAPDIFAKYKRALYLDSDTIVNADIYDLYGLNLDGYLLAGVLDIAFPVVNYQKYNSYFRSIGLYNCSTYINAGVILFNVEEFGRIFSYDFLINQLEMNSYKWPDQDLLNVLCKNRILCIDMTWNVFSLNEWLAEKLEDGLPDDLYMEYTMARKCPKIIHFVMHRTLNNIPVGDYSEEYWKYAKGTPFYENLIFR